MNDIAKGRGWVPKDGRAEFSFDGWTLVIYYARPDQIELTYDDGDVEAHVESDGLWCMAETTSGYYTHGKQFNLPWPILAELVDWKRKTLQAEAMKALQDDSMQTMLVRLKPYDPRRGFVLRRYTYQGIKFHDERGWYRVDKAVADYLRGVRQVAGDAHAPLAFDVHTESEAKALEAEQDAAATVRKKAADPVEAVAPSATSATVTTDDLGPTRADAPQWSAA